MRTLYMGSLGIGLVSLLLGWGAFDGTPAGDGISAGPVDSAGRDRSEQLPQPIVTRQTVFVIPFQIQPVQESSQQPVEVQLYVSTDQGRQWRLYHRVRPGEGHFLVRTTGEGEYWFLVRTVDRAGRVRPQAPPRPELRVLVDTTPPKLELTAEANESGQVSIRWKMTDVSLRPDTLRIGYRTAPEGVWQSVPMEGKQVQAFPEGQEGQVRWTPPPGSARLEIRAEVVDGAGNPAVAHAQVPFPAAQSLATLNAPANTLQNEQWRAMRREIPPPTSLGDTASPGTPVVPQNGQGQGGARAPGLATGQGDPHPNLLPKREENRLAGSIYPSTEAPHANLLPKGEGNLVASAIHPPIERQFVPRSASVQSDPAVPLRSDRPTPPPTGLSPRSRPDPSLGTQSDPAVSSKPKGADGTTEVLPTGAAVRMVNSRVFELEYELGTPVPPTRVELWATRDNGRTWQFFGQDTDNRSPIIVSVPQEGIYGFRVMVSADPRTPTGGPAVGEMPDVWIGVDWTRPTGRILSIEPQPSEPGWQVRIRWEAADRYLADKPISLFYSPTGVSGTWMAIATGLENTGQYTWNVPPQLSDRVYIRLEIRDQAGNLTVDQTPQAIPLGQRVERAKIRDVRPVNASTQGFPRG